jgi:mono/diheme cytochrome c family protein
VLTWVLLAFVLLLAACDSLPGKPTEADRPLRPAEVVDFATLYAQNCSGCHGADGLMGAARPLNDPLYLVLAGRERLVQLTTDGVPATTMPGFGASAGGMLTEQQIGIIADGLIERWGAAGAFRSMTLPAYAASGVGDAQAGGQTYATYCARCHGADGSGGEKGGSVVDGAYLGLVSDQALRLAVICGRIDLGMPNWSGYVAGQAMSEQEIGDVVAWLTAQRPKVP